MTDWKAIAEARGIVWDDQTAARQSAALDALESAFTPLAAEIPVDQEPSPVFVPALGGSR